MYRESENDQRFIDNGKLRTYAIDIDDTVEFFNTLIVIG